MNKKSDAVSLGAFSDMLVRISVVLGHTEMELKDLLELNPGEVIQLDRDVSDFAELHINGKLFAKGEVVVVGSKVGISIKEVIQD
ncbi:FliM/FliN family flagellar motor switch protein [Candidatus Sneabacter namystus]|uniref:Flagellar motor switch protein FliN n=1 Tax=Candidatus Sneabacter namystus TaxID=2601646 RepID=A0A5C0UIM4_9RICK|nr:FliM/FliN family flagellar motor C-terminal domain-containing protein [Candidatus Sneabacter namystus]QEK39637.1 FliM/FliN family flagellar motor switch protein [Candidatus Sneabacter namystus]